MQDSLIAAAEIGGNRLLALDESAIAACEDMQGHCIVIEITDLDFQLYCHPGGWGIRLSRQPPSREADARISGRLMALVNLAAEDDKVSTSIQERVNFYGDVALARRLQSLLIELDIDWEELLATRIGDVAAFQIHQRARRMRDWLQVSTRSLLQTSSEYLREEARLSPTAAEFDRFQAHIKDLRHGVDRAEARLDQLFDKLRR